MIAFHASDVEAPGGLQDGRMQVRAPPGSLHRSHLVRVTYGHATGVRGQRGRSRETRTRGRRAPRRGRSGLLDLGPDGSLNFGGEALRSAVMRVVVRRRALEDPSTVSSAKVSLQPRSGIRAAFPLPSMVPRRAERVARSPRALWRAGLPDRERCRCAAFRDFSCRAQLIVMQSALHTGPRKVGRTRWAATAHSQTRSSWRPRERLREPAELSLISRAHAAQGAVRAGHFACVEAA